MDLKTRELLKSNNKTRRKAEISSKFAKVDSPLAKYDSSGNLSCVLCRIPIKSNVWKVHLNSKQHKQFVELARQQRLEAENTSKAPKATNAEPVKEKNKVPITSENIIKNDTVKLPSAQLENVPTNQSSQNVLPEKFFDQDKSANAVDRNAEAEWVQFQREIKEAETISSIIVSEEQDSLNVKRHLKEIDEQIENWKRFEKINDKMNVLLKKQRKEKKPVQLEIDSSSGEECSVDDLLDWRIKSVHK